MNNKEIVTKLNELLSSSEIYDGMLDGEKYKNNTVHFSHYFEKRQKHVSFRLGIEYADLYRDIFWCIFNKGNIKDNYSIEDIENKFNLFLLESKVIKGEITSRRFDKFFNELNMASTTKVFVFHKIYGVDISSDNPVKIGCFTLYNYSLHKNNILEITGMKSENALLKLCDEFANHNTWISTEVETVDKEKAYELACDRCEVFQGICNFVIDIERYNAYCVCVLKDVTFSYNRCYMVSGTGLTDKGENDFKRIKNIDIQKLLYDKRSIFIPVVERLFSSEKSEINTRIKNAFKTYGRIIYEHSNCQKLIMYISVIESLIEYDSDKLTDLLSSYFSAMLSENIETYSIMKENFKITYGQRCDISHGRRTDILKGDLAYAKAYAAELILKFVTDKEIESLKKDKDLKAYLKSRVKRLEVQVSE